MTEEQPRRSSDPLGLDSLWYTAAGCVAVVIGALVFLVMRNWHRRIDHRNAVATAHVIERYPLLATQPFVTGVLAFLIWMGLIRIYVFFVRMEAK